MKFAQRRAVYRSKDGCYFSGGVKRDFGVNRVIEMFDGTVVISSVQPLKCEPIPNGLAIVGTIVTGDWDE